MSTHPIPSESPTLIGPSTFSVQENLFIHQAIALLESRIFQRGACINRPQALFDFLRLKLGGETNEVFAAVFLDSKHCVIAFEPLAHGTIDQAAIYPRVIVKRAIELNAAAVIFAHNHPSGSTCCSEADRVITNRLRNTLHLVDIRVLDHVIVGKGDPYSFAEAGLL
ncbi:DNA repair protein RadC [Xanthomonas axonopodis pv. vasculorum]|uniref:RadC family protein n=1 Tax=Xanthomonas axonopodis TaxID=53413 RepID=UPI000AC1B8A3|nr:DNA repair protein RadC [Xanthomonas axonopodis]PPV09783.1 DNA repair protein RadC [Xanthomonas axonopodis pv. vasculorum]QKD86764.1 DNA repair protein RadC [Xanthomonas axonopodis pv. vasculorum]